MFSMPLTPQQEADNQRLETILADFNTISGGQAVCGNSTIAGYIDYQLEECRRIVLSINRQLPQDYRLKPTHLPNYTHLETLLDKVKNDLKKLHAGNATAEEQTAAKLVTANLVVMFKNIEESTKDPSRAREFEPWKVSKYVLGRTRQTIRGEALGILDGQKRCFEALSKAYGEKFNKPVLFFTIASSVLMIGLSLCFLPFAYGFPIVGAGLHAMGTALTGLLEATPLGVFWGKMLLSLTSSVLLKNVLFPIVSKNFGGSSPSKFFEIAKPEGEQLSKDLQQMIALTDKLADEVLKADAKKQQEKAQIPSPYSGRLQGQREERDIELQNLGFDRS